jgi:hypothetical protein
MVDLMAVPPMVEGQAEAGSAWRGLLERATTGIFRDKLPKYGPENSVAPGCALLAPARVSFNDHVNPIALCR